MATRPGRLVRAITSAARERDRLEMKAVNALLSAISPAPRKKRHVRRTSRRVKSQP